MICYFPIYNGEEDGLIYGLSQICVGIDAQQARSLMFNGQNDTDGCKYIGYQQICKHLPHTYTRHTRPLIIQTQTYTMFYSRGFTIFLPQWPNEMKLRGVNKPISSSVVDTTNKEILLTNLQCPLSVSMAIGHKTQRNGHRLS